MCLTVGLNGTTDMDSFIMTDSLSVEDAEEEICRVLWRRSPEAVTECDIPFFGDDHCYKFPFEMKVDIAFVIIAACCLNVSKKGLCVMPWGNIMPSC